jgi:hypothetical protein
MKFRHSLILLPAIALTACNGGNENDAQTMIDPPGTTVRGSVVYSYPADGQSEVSTRADLVLRFSHAITDSNEALAEKIRVITGEQSVDFSITRIDEGRSLKLTPAGQLEPGAEYTVTFDGNLTAGTRAIPTPNAIGDQGIQFSTRAALTGSLQAENLADEFAVTRLIPAPDTAFLPADFSTFRLQLTRPVHPDWQAMGGTIELLDSNGEPVPATVLVKDRAITVDPCIADTPAGCGMDGDLLDYEQTYTLQIENLPGRSGGNLDYSASFTPEESAPHVTLYQQIVDSGLNAGQSEEQAERSLLNGQIINGITLESVLQGNAGPSQQTADLFAQVAYAPDNDNDFGVPLRIPRNSKLASSSLDIRINGLVPVINEATGDTQTTGDIKVTMLSDASGYLLPNPYSNSASAPRHVRLWMDIAMNTEEAMPNAALSQDIMGLELTGIAQVRDGLLTIDAIGIVEPRLLGLEDTLSTIAFRIEADTSADVQFDSVANRDADTTGPQLVSWMPGPADDPLGNRQQMQRPGDPVILNFDEPLDRDSVREGITLTANGTTYSHADGNLNLSIDGTSVALNPEGGLKHSVEYTVGIGSTVADMVGNGAAERSLSFALPESSPSQTAALVLGTYPGFPCATENLTLTENLHGFCIDRPARKVNVARPDGQPREELPVTTLPSDRPIIVRFSTPMNPDSINESTFIVETVPADTATTIPPGSDQASEVTGQFIVEPKRVRFVPDSPWEPGKLYRYTLVSTPTPTQDEIDDGADPIPLCSQSTPDFICSDEGYPLNTDILVDATDIGGPDMSIYFRGGEPLKTVLNPLGTLPQRDVNTNLKVDCQNSEGEYRPGNTDCQEPFPLSASDADSEGSFPPSENAAKLVVTEGGEAESEFIIIDGLVRVGCPTLNDQGDPAPDCPRNKFIYQTMGLNTEVVGRTAHPETGEPAVEVHLYPTMIVTTNPDVYLSQPLGRQPAGPQILRMRYTKGAGECEPDCARNQPIKGYIVNGEDGAPSFETEVDLLLDAPNLQPKLGTTELNDRDAEHNLFGYPLKLDLKGDVTFFDDGRMQIRQVNSNAASIDVRVMTSLSEPPKLLVGLPLELPAGGVFLNFISNPIKPTPTSE